MTRNKINNAGFRQRLSPFSKNIVRKQNPFDLVFEDISTFDAGNPVVGSLLKEPDVRRKDVASEIVKKAPGLPETDITLRNRLVRQRNRQEPNDNNSL